MSRMTNDKVLIAVFVHANGELGLVHYSQAETDYVFE